ncbi:DNA recombination protein RmuC [Oricola cellulosilytica]|uniref:DNA recombination protein RmuC homolog n=1 Tax=Oricola cellulosilytica TaxID=1429082 RepID=A0A4R0PIB4_9HYPH|nr:DNA recombination protein RmuC [Oricola cellulosilytica]TCD16464.1 DNA recombination protein RmuC [Oricola cellulosilytica]
MDFNEAISLPLVVIGDIPITLGLALAVFGVLFGLLTAVLVASGKATARRHAQERDDAARRAQESEARMGEILKAQSEMQGRMASMAEIFGSRQSELNQTIQQKLDSMTSRIGQSMSDQQKSTHENLARLQERLAVIDTAQNNIQQLAGQVVELQSILSNKQTRGAFGQARMEAIIADGLPMDGYSFQATLSNGSRPDCLIHMPNDSPALVIDAKFPLEAWNTLRGASDPAASAEASKQFRRDMDVHIKAISEKYLITGETQDTAFLFVPSESIFADIHENHEAIVQRAHKARLVIVSPSLLMLSVQVIQALLKDARMREQAHLIQSEVLRLMEDVVRLDERVHKLQTHFSQAQRDIDDILVSSGKVTRRGQKIEALEFEGDRHAATSEKAPQQTPGPSADSKTGQLRLRVVDSDPGEA